MLFPEPATQMGRSSGVEQWKIRETYVFHGSTRGNQSIPTPWICCLQRTMWQFPLDKPHMQCWNLSTGLAKRTIFECPVLIESLQRRFSLHKGNNRSSRSRTLYLVHVVLYFTHRVLHFTHSVLHFTRGILHFIYISGYLLYSLIGFLGVGTW